MVADVRHGKHAVRMPMLLHQTGYQAVKIRTSIEGTLRMGNTVNLH